LELKRINTHKKQKVYLFMFSKNKPEHLYSAYNVSTLKSQIPYKRLSQPGHGILFSFFKAIEVREVTFAGEKHSGLYASEFIPKGTVIYENDPLELETRSITRADLNLIDDGTRKRWWIYCWQLEENRYSGPRLDMNLDDALPRDALNYLNHSCDPNVGYDGDDCLVALRDIHQNEAITYDYAMSETDPEAFPEFECECNSYNCRGVIKPTDYLIPDVQTRYAGRFLSYVVKKQKEHQSARMEIYYY